MADTWDNIRNKREERRAARSACRKLWDGISGKLYRLWFYHLIPRAQRRKVAFFFQRRNRGFDETELWCLDWTILKFILPRLKAFRETQQGSWPGPEAIFDIDYQEYEELNGDEKVDLRERSLEEWDRMIDKMIRAIELQLRYEGVFVTRNPEWEKGDPWCNKFRHSPELEAEYDEGWNLFFRWFHHLWS